MMVEGRGQQLADAFPRPEELVLSLTLQPRDCSVERVPGAGRTGSGRAGPGRSSRGTVAWGEGRIRKLTAETNGAVATELLRCASTELDQVQRRTARPTRALSSTSGSAHNSHDVLLTTRRALRLRAHRTRGRLRLRHTQHTPRACGQSGGNRERHRTECR